MTNIVLTWLWKIRHGSWLKGEEVFEFLISFQLLPRLMSCSRNKNDNKLWLHLMLYLYHPTTSIHLPPVPFPCHPSSRTATRMTEKFSQEIPAALQPVATDNCNPVSRPGSEPSQTEGLPEGPVWPSLACPAHFMNGQISLWSSHRGPRGHKGSL